MRTAVAGFLLGYVVVALLVAPAVLCASGMAPSYEAGIQMALSRTGVLEPLRHGAMEAVEFRDRAMWLVEDFLNRRVVPHVLRLPA